MPNRGSWVEINLGRLRRNIQRIQHRSKADIILPVKADAYGHGAVETVKVARECGIDFFCVANVGEAVELRQAGVQDKILLVVPLVKDDCEAIIQYDLRPTICNVSAARELSKIALKTRHMIRVHLEVDTGMGRGGVWHHDFLPFFRAVVNIPEIRIEGIYTHFASADEGDLFFTEEQLRRFRLVLFQIESLYRQRIPIIHSDNSSAILQLGAAGFSHVRPGIAVYGYYPSRHIQKTIKLEPVMSCKTELVHIQDIQKGRSVSYNRTYFLREDSQVGVIDIGYADGYSRRLSNRGKVLLRGKKAPVIGAVCMDMTMVNLENIPYAKINDEVVILGRQGNEEITIEELAESIGTIHYEVATLLGLLNKRVFIDEVSPHVKNVLFPSNNSKSPLERAH
ncbi:MAG: alanine racemase [Candidatus Cloacimonetes bacterium 4572_55]|nr:MAG: alanine racemase [Candidatus Cloacimonetes bacterium 4572_55]